MSTPRRESSWLALRRCWAMVLRLQRGPASRAALIEAVMAAETEPYGGVSGKQLTKRFEADKRRLEEHLGIRIRYDRREHGYIISEQHRALHDIPDSQLRTLAFLADAFQPDSPYAEDVQTLYQTLRARLSSERQQILDRARGLLSLDLQQRDSDPISADIWQAVQTAYQHQQQLSFLYYSSQHDDNMPRQHVVEPWDFYFDTERRHYYLRGFCLFNDGPKGAWKPYQYISYRLGRIAPESAEILPTKLPPHPRRPRPYQAIYELAPAIARFGVSRRAELLAPPKTYQLDNGWVRVEGHTGDIFRLARSLLYYGPGCRVLGGPELLAEVRGLVSKMADYYERGITQTP